jgi:hypothetical protein
LLHSLLSYYNMHFNYTAFTFRLHKCDGTYAKVWLVLFILCLDQPGVNFMLGSFASAYIGWFNGTSFNLDLFYAIYVIQEHYACLIGTWRSTQESRTTTRHKAPPWRNN